MNIVMKFKIVIVSTLVIIAIALNIYKVSKVHGNNLVNNAKDAIISLSTKKYKTALKNYESTIDYCKKQEKNNKITDENKKILNSISLTSQQLDKAIYILNKRALFLCESKQFGLFLIERGMYSETLKYYKVLLDDDYYGDDMLFVTPQSHFQIELDYLKIPRKLREKIESIKQLNKPFYPFDIIERNK
ncbi:hypothetical protein MNBD_GAMMA22-2422 [hydrothermal vent metagenome]|uniref:Uncharacterized protein n=1 Tax=hydrothermal vent metagenome TaxID=652676 RepID=A0A3B1API9_9ZZZZ